MISCIILSAGLSSRFGSPKAIAKFDKGESVIEHIQNMLVTTPVEDIIVVLGAESDCIKPFILNHKRVKFVYNKNYNLGQTSSFKVGLNNISDRSEAVLLLPVDYPLVKGNTVANLTERFMANKPLIIIPTFEGEKGHPPIFHIQLKEAFLGLDVTAGLNTMAAKHRQETMLLPVDDSGVVTSFNSTSEFENIKKDAS